MAEDKNLDLLDLEDEDVALPELPEDDPFCTPRPKRPWLLFALGLAVVILATYIIVSVIRSGETDSMDISLDVPVTSSTEPTNGASFADGADQLILGAAEESRSNASAENGVTGAPTRVVQDRAEVKFNPAATPTVDAPKPRPIAKPQTVKPKPVQKSAARPVAGGYSVQFASLSTRSAAEREAARIKRLHPGLLGNKEFVILAAEVNGATVYRVRLTGFKSAAEASGFCSNAKSDGLDCYVVK
jgi:cell division septation protein DedD